MKFLVNIILILSVFESATAQQTFNSLNDVIEYANKKSITLQTNDIRLNQIKKAKLAALISIPDISGNVLSASFTDNTRLPVSLFPAETFGGQKGEYREITTGVQYNTTANTYVDIKLLNLQSLENLKLAKVNIELTVSNNQLSTRSLHESIAPIYFNIITLQEQLKSSRQNLAVADTLFQIVRNKYQQGLAKQQDVNDAKVSILNTKEGINQIEFLIKQYELSLKILCDIPESETLTLNQTVDNTFSTNLPNIERNNLTTFNSMLKEKNAEISYKSAKLALMPTMSFVFSNSYQVFNPEFSILGGKWINSNYLGLKLNVPIPSANTISKKTSAFYDYQLAQKNTEQVKIKADLDHRQLSNDYEKALSQYTTNREVLALRKDSYDKNKNLYTEGVLGLDQTINSFNAMINANYNLISSKINVLLAQAKIEINNK
jgi:outer membrane protein